MELDFHCTCRVIRISLKTSNFYNFFQLNNIPLFYSYEEDDDEACGGQRLRGGDEENEIFEWKAWGEVF